MVTQRIDIPVHIPQPYTNILHFPVNANYQTMQIWRTDPGWIGFKLINVVNVIADPSGVFYDDSLTDGANYRYYLIATGLSGARTAPTAVFTGIPKANPVAPKGWLTINNSAIKTDRLNVLLQVDINDTAKQMLISENVSFTGAAWKPIQSNSSFTLSSTGDDEMVTLYAKFRDADNNESIMYSASIIVAINGDEDNDGIPNNLDTDDDSDGLVDNLELAQLRTDPFKPDTNGDGINDAREDPDRDLIPNLREIDSGTDPLHNLSDVSGDNEFNALDINLFRNAFITGGKLTDVNADGKINALDINSFRSAFRSERSYK